MRGRVLSLMIAVVALTACEQTGSPILRGVKLPSPESQQPLEPEIDESSSEQASDVAAPEEPVQLNLTLPSINWDDNNVMLQYSVLPDVFHKGSKQPSMNWSGKLHLDESEEARARPITENILGAEVELQLRLP
ncbi:hypothetical protein ACQUQU_11870 [Thalassolituus sp. LLYu03]|uniref:hypothetical protein n=1 Tax=Thalassolituus sp. LLYu03 TaxID=3421656 RepID=UPI003D2B667C